MSRVRRGWCSCADPLPADRRRTGAARPRGSGAAARARRGPARAASTRATSRTGPSTSSALQNTNASAPSSSTTSTGRDALGGELHRLGPHADDDPVRPLSLAAAGSVQRLTPPNASAPSGPIGTRAEVHRGRADEAGHERVHGPVVKLARRVALLEQPVPQHRDAVAERHRLGLVVRDVDGRRAQPRLERGDVGAHLDAQLGIEVRERLVHQEHAAASARSRGPSPRAGAGRRRADRACARGTASSRAARRPRARARRARPSAPCAIVQREGDVVRDREIRVQRVVLEDHRDVAALGRVVGHVAVADPERAGIDLLEPGEHPQRGRLARARGPTRTMNSPSSM